MLEKPLEWRRFERVELEGEVARIAPRISSASSVSPTPSLLQEFERILRENERLQIEIATLREEAARNDSGTHRYREELKSARVELAQLEGDPKALQPTRVSDPHTRTDHQEGAPIVPAETNTLSNVAAIIAGYIFADPSDMNVRLVADALRARGLEGDSQKG